MRQGRSQCTEPQESVRELHIDDEWVGLKDMFMLSDVGANQYDLEARS